MRAVGILCAVRTARRAQLHERRGEQTDVLDYYGKFIELKFIELWNKAAPALAAEGESARKAMKGFGRDVLGQRSMEGQPVACLSNMLTCS